MIKFGIFAYSFVYEPASGLYIFICSILLIVPDQWNSTFAVILGATETERIDVMVSGQFVAVIYLGKHCDQHFR